MNTHKNFVTSQKNAQDLAKNDQELLAEIQTLYDMTISDALNH